MSQSLSTRREWVEIQKAQLEIEKYKSLSPHGESGLKLQQKKKPRNIVRLSPHGESGLKFRMEYCNIRSDFVSLHTERVG